MTACRCRVCRADRWAHRLLAVVAGLVIAALLVVAFPADGRVPTPPPPITDWRAVILEPTATITSPAAPSFGVREPSAGVSAALSVRGVSSWYDYVAGQAAAGPALRAALGPSWRGQVVTVCAGRCIRVVLTDWCQCFGVRVIDLDRDSFAELASPDRGLVTVEITQK